MKVTDIFKYDENSDIVIKHFFAGVKAGFTSPAEGYIDELSFTKKYIKHPAATFFTTVRGESMINAGIFDGDTLIVDRAIDYKDDKVVIAVMNNELTVKKINVVGDKKYLKAENENFPDIEIRGEEGIIIFGVATYNIHPL
jgi:DNA polymerase V